VRDVLSASAFFCHPSCATPDSLRVGTKPARQQHRSAQGDEAVRKADHHAHDFKKSVWPLFLDGVTPASQWHSAIPHVRRKSVKELQSLASIFMHSFIASESMHFGQMYHDIDRQACMYRVTQGLPGLG
jgi:hypothetical protein